MRFPILAVRRLLAASVLVLAAGAAHALTVVPPTFDELVAKANVVVRGVVTKVEAKTVETSQGTAIKTYVTFKVERTLKGTTEDEVTLQFLGGKVGRRTLKVVGMPTFSVGDREIVFVGDNGRVICPLIAAGHGRYRLETDPATKVEHVARENHAPLASTAEIAAPLDHSTAALSSSAAMTREDFESRIIAAVSNSQTASQK
ncbi:hypothetical protein [Opitutus sp. ER46]|uniref:hypothetical protein n=1 Tax=Opitutus sp. ER46 TaxID=2161864 RepID=UPI000D3044D8|nr:hypothetical protein [Opitutus sp. ER46]PTX97709.1 hypothetical protein DB354_05360 [Opitutus sp. ER46]